MDKNEERVNTQQEIETSLQTLRESTVSIKKATATFKKAKLIVIPNDIIAAYRVLQLKVKISCYNKLEQVLFLEKKRLLEQVNLTEKTPKKIEEEQKEVVKPSSEKIIPSVSEETKEVEEAKKDSPKPIQEEHDLDYTLKRSLPQKVTWIKARAIAVKKEVVENLNKEFIPIKDLNAKLTLPKGASIATFGKVTRQRSSLGVAKAKALDFINANKTNVNAKVDTFISSQKNQIGTIDNQQIEQYRQAVVPAKEQMIEKAQVASLQSALAAVPLPSVESVGPKRSK